MRYKLLLSFFALICLIGIANAGTINSFNDSSTSGNLTFTDIGNFTRYLSINKNYNITSAFIDLSGYYIVANATTTWFNESDGFYIDNDGSATLRGVTTNGTDFWVVNSSNINTYGSVVHYLNGVEVDWFKFPTSTFASGITLNDSNIFILDTGGWLYILDYDGNLDNKTALGGYLGSGFHGKDIKTNGSDFWVMDAADIGQGFMFHLDSAFQNLSDGFDIKHLNLDDDGYGFAYNNSDFWFGGADEKNLVHTNYNGTDLNDNLSLSHLDLAPSFLTTGNFTTGGTPEEFWIIDKRRYQWVSHIKGNITAGYPTNPILYVNGSNVWEHSGEFDLINNITADFSTVINDALNNCSGDASGNCIVNSKFYSDTVGEINWSNLNVTHTYEANLYRCSESPAENFTAFNFTLRKEIDRSNISDVNISKSFKATFITWKVEDPDEKTSTSFSIVNATEIFICVKRGVNLSTTADIEYVADNYDKRFHYLVNYSIQDNVTSHIQLSLLEIIYSTIFLVSFEDSSYLPVENAIIDIWRKYLGLGQFLSVEHGKTNADGETIAHLVTDEVIYKFYVMKDGELLYVSPESIAMCQETPCQINLRQSETVPMFNFTKTEYLIYILTLDRDTRTVTFEFTTRDGSSRKIDLNVTKIDAYMNDTVCEETVTTSAGSLSCVVPSTYANTTYHVYIQQNEEFVTYRSFNLNPDPTEWFGDTGIIMTFLLVLTLALMSLSSGIAVIAFTIIGVIIAGLLMIFTGGEIFGVGSAILWLIIAGIIIIIKISTRRSG